MAFFTLCIRRLLLTLFSIGSIVAVLLGMLTNPFAHTASRFLTKTAPRFFSSSSSSSSSFHGMTDSMSPGRPVVIIVGSGLAGLSAANEALAAGAKVRMLERGPKPGGNSIKASSGINGAGTRFQKARGIEHDDLFRTDTIKSAGRRYDSRKEGNVDVDREALVRSLTDRSAAAVEWLVDDIGVDLSVVATLGGHSVARTHRGGGKMPPGAAIVTALLKKLSENPNFQLTTSAEVTGLDVEAPGVVRGVRFRERAGVDAAQEQDQQQQQEQQEQQEEETLSGPVVFAAGGFAGDAHGLLARHRPDLAGIPSTNDARPGAHDILSAPGVGAELVDMDSVQIHPTGFVDPNDPASPYKFLAAEMLRGEGGIMLSRDGRRFVNELDTREVVSRAVMALPAGGATGGEEDGVRQWDITLLLDPGACEAAASHLGFYTFKGLVQRKKVKDLDPAVIEAVDAYAATVAAHKEDEFGRTTFGHWRLAAGEANREEEVCVGKVTPVVHFTMGGVAFNNKAEVLRRDTDESALKPIQGLWAAGEITGGLHGDNRLGGSSLLECVVFGREAGRAAAAWTSV